MSELVIDESNFEQYFRNTKKTKPQKGDVMAIYRATAELTSGSLKEQVVEALCSEEIGAKKAIQLIIKLGQTNRREATKLIKQICSDLYGGMQKNYVIAKSYKYIFEMFFYTKKEHIPKDDSHWEVIVIKNLDDHLDKDKDKDKN